MVLWLHGCLRVKGQSYHSPPASVRVGFALLAAAAEANVEGAIAVVVFGCRVVTECWPGGKGYEWPGLESVAAQLGVVRLVVGLSCTETADNVWYT